MKTSGRGRSGSRSLAGSGNSSFFGRHTASGSAGRTSSATAGGTGRKLKSGSEATTPSGYKGCSTSFAGKIQSYKTLFTQTTGQAKFTRPTPTTLNTFANWVNKGAIVQTVTTAQVARWAKTTSKTFSSRSATPTSCKNVLCAKFGKTTIKAVCRNKSGSFMVATSPTISGRTFCFPK